MLIQLDCEQMQKEHARMAMEDGSFLCSSTVRMILMIRYVTYKNDILTDRHSSKREKEP